MCNRALFSNSGSISEITHMCNTFDNHVQHVLWKCFFAETQKLDLMMTHCCMKHNIDYIFSSLKSNWNDCLRKQRKNRRFKKEK
jgi:hypothetical protein